jgi:hypothetical protein
VAAGEPNNRYGKHTGHCSNTNRHQSKHNLERALPVFRKWELRVALLLYTCQGRSYQGLTRLKQCLQQLIDFSCDNFLFSIHDFILIETYLANKYASQFITA